MADKIEKKIAELVSQKGGRVFYVGGYVRDKLLGIENKDVDIEVHGITPENLLSLLKEVGEPISYGTSFGIYSLKGHDIDIALPRKEHTTGRGHKDFEVFVDPFIGTKEAARRRDFTINSLMQDVLTDEIIDAFGGENDLKNKVIKHIDAETFIEDPLRVLRAAQFASRFEFTVDGSTIKLCRDIDISTLSRERVEEELKKALLKGEKPSIFFKTLREMNQLSLWFPELEKLIDLKQDSKFHPEGDVWAHTMEVIDRAASYRNEVSDAYSFMLLSLTHDFGKIITTEEIDRRIHAYGHEILGLPIIEEFLNRIVSETAVKEYVLNMAPLHMKPNMLSYSKSAVKKTNKLFDEAIAPKDIIYFSMCDKPVFSGDDPFTGDSEFLFNRLNEFEAIMAKPYVTGQDLIDAGLKPGEYFSDILAYAHKLRLAGIDKENALTQTLSYARKVIKGENKCNGKN